MYKASHPKTPHSYIELAYAVWLFIHITINLMVGGILAFIAYRKTSKLIKQVSKDFLLSALLILVIGFSTCLSVVF
jgi:hypothetical protein